MARGEEVKGTEDDEMLVRELLDNETPFFLLPQVAGLISVAVPSPSPEAMSYPFLSKLYSGPTIEDVETAVSATCKSIHSQEHATSGATSEKRFRRMENKCRVKMICSGNALGEDGYKWRKYGQKSLKNSPNPRSYYRCTTGRCSAKKQVERLSENPDAFIVTYEGLHFHFTYSHLLAGRPTNFPPKKRPKNHNPSPPGPGP